MKKQSLLKLLIVAVIISAAFLMVSASRASHTVSKEDCTADKSCEQNTQTEFFLESLTRSLLSK